MTKHDPVAELVFTVQFPSVAGMTAVDVSELYQRLKDNFPTVQHAPRLPPLPATAQAMGQAIFQNIGLLPRTWFISSDSHRLVQIQDDRISFNWRRQNSPDYPSYDALRVEFAAIIRHCREWFAERFSSEFKPTLGELYYANHIPLRNEAGADIRLFEVFAFQKEMKRKVGNFTASWFEPPAEGEEGFTTINVGTSMLPEGTPIAILNIAAVIPVNADTPAQSWLDVAHTRALEMFQNVVIATARKLN